MSKVYKWRIFCIDENKWVYTWSEDGTTLPTKCFNQPLHQINPESINITESVSENTMRIQEETTATQGNFRLHGKKIIGCLPNSVTTDSYTLIHDINLSSVWINVSEANKVDVFNAYYQPNLLFNATITGVDELLLQSISFIDYLNIGYFIVIANELYEICSVNKITGKIRLVKTLTGATGTVIQGIKININGVRDFNLASTGRHSVGAFNIRSSYLPKDGNIIVTYTNKSITLTKDLYYDLEYMY